MDGFLRINHIIGQPERKVMRKFKTGPRLVTVPAIPAIIPVSKTTWWRKVKKKEYPQPVHHLGARTTAWRKSDIQKLVDKFQEGE